MLNLIRLSLCDAMLGSGDARWEMEKLRAALSNPLRAPTHQELPHPPPDGALHQVLPQQSALRLVYNCNWWFVVLPYSDLAMVQPCLSTSLQGGLKTSWCFQPPWRIISKDYATSMVLVPQACCLACPCQEHRAISQSFQMTLLWVLGAWASSHSSHSGAVTKALLMPKEVWAGANTSTMEPSCTLPWKDQHR